MAVTTCFFTTVGAVNDSNDQITLKDAAAQPLIFLFAL